MATIKDIARETGLGLATISSYLNNGHVREKNRIKIEAAIKDLHYEVNETARNLKTNRTRMIGAVIPELGSAFVAEVLSTMEDLLIKKGYALVVCDCRSDKVREQEAVNFLIRRRVDGLINIPVDETGDHLQKYTKTGKPLVLVDRLTESLVCDTVCTRNREAIYQAVEQLIAAGHRKIAMIAGPGEIQAARSRRIGYVKCLEDHGIRLPEGYLYPGDDTIQGGIKGVMTLLKDHPDLTALVVSNSLMSQGAVIALNEQNIRVPEQISMIGFDNPQFARAVNPRLTIVQQPVQAIGTAAARLLLRRLEMGREGKSELPQHIWLDTEILEGKSVRKLI